LRSILSEKIIRRRPGTRLISVDARVLGLVFSAAIAVMFSAPVTDTFAADTPLLEPYNLIVDRSLVREQADAQIIAARRYDTFWNTGDEALARAALAPNFIDNTLPTGRPQGLAGPLAASKLIRLAIPDIRCEIEQMIVAGDRVVAPAFPTVTSQDASGRCKAKARRSTSSPPTFTASPMDASLRIGTSKTT
jgi:SnoaL-like polyketide cyclase